MAGYWFALRCKARKEDVVWRQVISHGFESYYPRLRVHPVNPRSRKIRPYFPGYLFVYADLDDVGLSVFKWMPHTFGLVSFGGETAIVPENLIHSIRKRVDEINDAGGEILDNLHKGDVVRISDGPFKGYEAIFDARLAGNERVRVLLELLGNQRRVPVEMNTSQIQPKRK
jgi:transcriptional antiterminator RfaH